MKKTAFFSFFLALCLLLASCGRKTEDASVKTSGTISDTVMISETAAQTVALKDGRYSAYFKTDSSMFHVNEAYHGKGVLTVKDGKMTIHVTMPSKNVVNLFYGKAEQAKADGAVLIEPSTESVTYDDGITEEVFGFDIPVPYLDDEFDCALIGAKGVWYDHKVSVSGAVLLAEDGEYTMEITVTGGTGRASISSPANITVKDGSYSAEIVWSSTHYEYMELDGTRYEPVQTSGNSTFIIPIVPDSDIKVSAMTTAMSEPHVIEYVLHFDGGTLKKK